MVNKRRSVNEGIYPIERLSQKRELPRKYSKPPRRKDYFSPWTEEKKKQRKYLQDRKRALNDIGAKVNNSRDGSNERGGISGAKQMQHSQSARNFSLTGEFLIGDNAHDPENGKNNPETLGADDQSKSLAGHRKSV